MKLEIVTHCYCPPRMPFYAAALRWQWASLIANPSQAWDQVELVVCWTTKDKATLAQMEKMAEPRSKAQNVSVRSEPFPPEQLFRRAIARNHCALTSKADVVWFADVDYFVGSGFLNNVAETVKRDTILAFPNDYQINIDHRTGDRIVNGEALSFDPEDFCRVRASRPIGGMMFVGGDWARRGYLHGTRHTMPVGASAGFRQCKCDVHYRKWLLREQAGNQSATRAEMPGLFRIRHTENGRDKNLQGD